MARECTARAYCAICVRNQSELSLYCDKCAYISVAYLDGSYCSDHENGVRFTSIIARK